VSFDIPNVNAASKISIHFGVGSDREFVPAASSKFLIDLGFITSTSLVCQVWNANGTLSYIWEEVDTSVAGEVSLTLKYDLLDPSTYVFTLVCNNGCTPDDTMDDFGLGAKWVESQSGATVQDADEISYAQAS
jgi:hypothetical protein